MLYPLFFLELGNEAGYIPYMFELMENRFIATFFYFIDFSLICVVITFLEHLKGRKVTTMSVENGQRSPCFSITSFINVAESCLK